MNPTHSAPAISTDKEKGSDMKSHHTADAQNMFFASLQLCNMSNTYLPESVQ